MFSLFCFFFFKQKTAYEMRISDWSSDVCSSDLGKSMVLDPVDLFISEAGLAPLPAQTAEGAVTLMPTGTTGDLRHLSDGQPTHAPPIELAQRSKGDMGDSHVQPHADGVGSDPIIHHHRLKQLGRAAGRERRGKLV